MKKSLFILGLVLLAGNIVAQDVQSSKAMQIQFFSAAPLEDIEATTKNGNAIITTSKNELFFLVPIKSFTFKSSLMQEHFNENYMESDKYPDARFQGKVTESIDWKKDGTYPVTAVGKLTVHGVERERTITGTIQIVNGVISLQSKFDIVCKEHGIKIPSMMTEKIAENVAVSVSGAFAPYVKK
jgi:hypothetical protein